MSMPAAILTIARITLVRLRRGRALWVGGLIAALPVLFAIAIRLSGGGRNPRETLFGLMQLVLAVMPGLFVASAVGEDIEDRTIAYLWARPVPRGAVLLGKWLALAPLVTLLVLVSWSLTEVLGPRGAPSPASLLGLGLGALVACAVGGGLGTIVPRHGMALSIVYLLFFDLILGAMPVSLANLSVSHHARLIGYEETSELHGIVWLVGLGALWLVIGLRRMRKLEA